jgi:hypothetical protein
MLPPTMVIFHFKFRPLKLRAHLHVPLEIIRQRLDINERSYNRLIKRYQTLVDGPLKDRSEMCVVSVSFGHLPQTLTEVNYCWGNSEAAYVLFSLEVDAFVQNLTKNKGTALRHVANREMEGFEHEIDRISEGCAGTNCCPWSMALTKTAPFLFLFSKEAEQLATAQSIQTLQLQLVEAQQERRNKIEYDGLAKEINKLPSRAANTE